MRPNDRSFKRIRTEDLARLAAIARADRNDLFRRNPELAAVYADRLLCVALCQGAALHYLDGRNGVKDFDVWSFFKAHPRRAFPARRNMHRDFGDRRFGVSPDRPVFVGRRVDLIGRSIPFQPGQTAVEAVREYLRLSTRSVGSSGPCPRAARANKRAHLSPALVTLGFWGGRDRPSGRHFSERCTPRFKKCEHTLSSDASVSLHPERSAASHRPECLLRAPGSRPISSSSTNGRIFLTTSLGPVADSKPSALGTR